MSKTMQRSTNLPAKRSAPAEKTDNHPFQGDPERLTADQINAKQLSSHP